MAGLDEPDSGAILKPAALTVGYLPQDGLTHAGRTVFEEASQRLRRAARDEGRDARARGAARRPVDSRGRARRDARTLQRSAGSVPAAATATASSSKTATVLQGLGFKTADFERPTETFSGGWQMRIALAKLLLGQPNLLLLDEPTNHLDLEARNWLEKYLNAYPHAVILVSHDRFFLDAVVTRIADLHAAHADRLRRQLQPATSSRTRRASSSCARRSASRTRKSRASRCSSTGSATRRRRLAGAEPHQDAREGRADRGAARAQEDPLRLPRVRARAAGRCSS